MGGIVKEVLVTEIDEISVLSKLSLFADLSMLDLEAMTEDFDEEYLAAGQRIIRAGIDGAGFCVILEGEADIVDDGQVVGTLRSGDFFGEVSAILGRRPDADVVCRTPVRCLVLPGAEMEEFLLRHPRVMLRMLQAEARRLVDNIRWLS